MKSVFVSIINFNGKKNTLDCLSQIDSINVEGLDLTVLVIDNASEEKIEIEDNFLKNFPLVFIKNDKNLGFSGGHNIGIKYAFSNGADYVIVLNNDVVLDKNFIRELILSAEKENGIISPKIYFAKGFEYHKDRYKKEDLGKVFWYAGGQMDWKNVIGSHIGVDEVDRGQFDSKCETEYATGCCMLISKEIFKSVGAFDKKYFLYYEDNDLCQRAKAKGFKVFYEPKSVIWHKNAGSAGGSGSVLQDYYITRNRLLFGIKYAPMRSRLALVKESISLLLKGRRWQKIAVKDFYLRRLGKGSYKND